MNNRQTMRNTNRMAYDWLLKNGYDYIWFKPHMDGRRKKETYLTKQGRFYQTDLYNLFDGMCFDSEGRVVFIQTSTRDYHPAKKYEDFFLDKDGTYCIMIKAVKKDKRWEIRTKTIRPPMRFENV